MKPVYSVKTPFDYPLDYKSKMTSATKHSLFVHDHKVALVASHQFTGINKKSDKRWFRWETKFSDGFWRNDKGTIIPFSVIKDGRHFKTSLYRNEVFNPSVNHSGMIEQYRRSIYDTFGITELADVYPMARPYQINEYVNIPAGMHSYFRQTNEKDFVKSIFGKNNYRRDLLKAVCSTDPFYLAIAKQFRGLVPIDWIIGWLREFNGLVPTGVRMDLFRKRLLAIDPRSYRHLLRDNDINIGRYVADIIRFIHDIEPVYVRSFEEFHNIIWGNTARYAAEENKPIKQLPGAKQLHELQVNDLTFKTAQETNDMVKWSSVMSNCISGYRHTALIGAGIYGAIERGNKVIANYEIRNGVLTQMLGRFNQKLPKDVKQLVVDALTVHGVDCSGDWWGK